MLQAEERWRGSVLGWHGMHGAVGGLTFSGLVPLDADMSARRAVSKGARGENLSWSIGFRTATKPKTAEYRPRAIENSS